MVIGGWSRLWLAVCGLYSMAVVGFAVAVWDESIPPEGVFWVLLILLVPCCLLYVLGHTVRWIVDGFKKRD